MASAGTCAHTLPRTVLRADPVSSGRRRGGSGAVLALAHGHRGRLEDTAYSQHAQRPRQARHPHVNTSKGSSHQVPTLNTTTRPSGPPQRPRVTTGGTCKCDRCEHRAFPTHIDASQPRPVPLEGGGFLVCISCRRQLDHISVIPLSHAGFKPGDAIKTQRPEVLPAKHLQSRP